MLAPANPDTFRYAGTQFNHSEVFHRHVGRNVKRLTHFGFFNRSHPGATEGQNSQQSNETRGGDVMYAHRVSWWPGLTGAAPVASWNTNRTRPPRPAQADCSRLCSLELDLPKLLFKKFSGYRVQVIRGRWVSQGFSRSFWWPWRTARRSWLWLRRFLLLPVLHDSVAERLAHRGRPFRDSRIVKLRGGPAIRRSDFGTLLTDGS